MGAFRFRAAAMGRVLRQAFHELQQRQPGPLVVDFLEALQQAQRMRLGQKIAR
jgi:glyoxylate carboligase